MWTTPCQSQKITNMKLLRWVVRYGAFCWLSLQEIRILEINGDFVANRGGTKEFLRQLSNYGVKSHEALQDEGFALKIPCVDHIFLSIIKGTNREYNFFIPQFFMMLNTDPFLCQFFSDSLFFADDFAAFLPKISYFRWSSRLWVVVNCHSAISKFPNPIDCYSTWSIATIDALSIFDYRFWLNLF